MWYKPKDANNKLDLQTPQLIIPKDKLDRTHEGKA